MTITTLSTFVQQCINNFAAALIRNKTLILQCIGFTFLWGLIAHGYMFANNNLSWDSLMQIIEPMYDGSAKVAVAGRIFVPAYEFLTRGMVTIPWLIGIITLLYISIATFLVSKLFNLHSTFSIFLIAGILVANPTVTAINATFISDLDADMLAMALSVLSAYCWRKMRYGWIWGAIPLLFAIGLYQSYISTTIVLIIFICVLDLLKGKPSKDILCKGGLAIVMILLAGLLYFAALKLTFAILDKELISGSHNSLDIGLSMTPKQFFDAIFGAYTNAVHGILFMPSVYRGRIISVITGLLLLCPACVVMKQLFSKKIQTGAKVLIVVLLGVTPLAMNVCHVLTNNFSHDLMHYAFWLIYLFVLIVLKCNTEEQIINHFNFAKWSKILNVTLLLIMLFWQVRLANLAYFVKDVENKAVHSLYTRLISDIEEYPGYVVKETKVAFMGVPSTLLNNNNEAYARAHGLFAVWPVMAIFHPEHYISYFLCYPATFTPKKQNIALFETEAVQAMPLYPAEGSMQMMDDILVVKLGDVLLEKQ